MAEQNESRCVYTPEEREAIDAIRKHFGDRLTAKYDDPHIRRFVRQKKTLPAIIAALEADVVWRTEMQADTVLEWLPKEPWFQSALNYWPGGEYGVDKYGVPVYWERTGLIDPRSLCNGLSTKQFAQLKVYLMERGERARRQADLAAGRESGKWLERGSCVVMDASGLGLQHMYPSAVTVFKSALEIDDLHYPTAFRRIFIIGAPGIASTLYSIIQPVLGEEKMAALKLFQLSEDPLPTLREEFGDFVPNWAGGSATDHGIGSGGQYPISSVPGCREVTVSAGSFHTEELVLEKPTNVLVTFRPTDKDISFKILRVLSPQQRDPVASFEKVAHWVMHSQDLDAGKYHFSWDNSYSLFTSKNVLLKIETWVPPESTKPE